MLGRDVTWFGDDTVKYLRTPESSVTPLWKLQEVLEEEFSPMPLYPGANLGLGRLGSCLGRWI